MAGLRPRNIVVSPDGSRVAVGWSDGSAGIYSLVRPADSAAVFAPKLDALRASGAKTLVTANPGCQLQWETGIARAGIDVRVMHIAEVLDAAMKT